MSRKKDQNSQTPQRRLATIMFTDIVGYSALTQKNESLALEVLEEHRRLLRPLFAEHGGKEIKTIGDRFLVEFGSALESARCAIEMQKTLVEHNASAAAERRIQIRIGLHLGDVVHHENDVYGDGVNIASRIEPLAEPGGICISEDLARQIQNKIEEPVVRLGKGELKNIDLPVALYRVVLPWEGWRPALQQRLVFSLRKGSERFRLALEIVLLILLLMIWFRENRAISPASAGDEAGPAAGQPVAEMHFALRAYLEGQIPPQTLRIVYEEVHPSRGSSRIVVQGTGQVHEEGTELFGGRYRRLTEGEIENLVRLLLDIQAWEQRMPWRAAQPGEVRTYLRLQAGPASSAIWEWYSDLDQQDRIVQLLDRLKNLALLEPEQDPQIRPLRTKSESAAPGDSSRELNRELMRAAGAGNRGKVQTLLQSGAEAEAKTEDSTPLIEAARGGHTEVVHLLVQGGADVNARNKEGTTALMEAAGRGRRETVRALIAYGADIESRRSKRSFFGTLKSFLGGESSDPAHDATPLMLAAANGHAGTVEVLLAGGARVNHRDRENQTALMRAAAAGQADVVKLLLKAGADARVKDKQGRTALEHAQKSGHSRVVELLRKP